MSNAEKAEEACYIRYGRKINQRLSTVLSSHHDCSMLFSSFLSGQRHGDLFLGLVFHAQVVVVTAPTLGLNEYPGDLRVVRLDVRFHIRNGGLHLAC